MSVRFFVSPPPFERLLPAGAVADAHPFGSIILVKVAGPTTTDMLAIRSLLVDWRRSHLDKPFVLWCENGDPATNGLRAAQLGFRGILQGAAPDIGVLKPQLTTVTGLDDHVIRWAKFAGFTFEATAESHVRHVLAYATRHTKVEHLIVASGGKPRTWRMRVDRSGLPPLGTWLRLHRVLLTGLWIERNPNAALPDVAELCGWPDAPTLSQRCFEVFGVRPTSFRSWLDIEPAMCCWLVRRRNRQNLAGDGH